MSKSIKTVILWVFVILLSVSMFIYFGDTGGNLSSNSRVLGTVNGYPIVNKRMSDFANTMRSLQSLYESRGIDVSQYGEALANEAFRRAIVNYLVFEEAEQNKITVSDIEIINTIKKDYFQNDEEEFNSFVKTGEADVQRDLEELMRKRLIKNYYEDIFNGTLYSQSQFDEKIEVSSRQRKALVALMSLSEQAERSISDNVLEKYYQDNQSRYDGESNNTFENLKKDIRSDYLLENKESLVVNIQNNISFQFQNLNSNRVDVKDFRKLAEDNNMVVVKTSYFNFYSQSVVNETGKGEPIINDRATIRKLFFIPVKSISQVIPREDTIAIAYITEERVEKDTSDFVEKFYINELNKEMSANIYNAFYSFLFNNAEVEVNNPSLGSR